MSYHRVTKEFLESMDYKALGEFIDDRFLEMRKFYDVLEKSSHPSKEKLEEFYIRNDELKEARNLFSILHAYKQGIISEQEAVKKAKELNQKSKYEVEQDDNNGTLAKALGDITEPAKKAAKALKNLGEMFGEQKSLGSSLFGLPIIQDPNMPKDTLLMIDAQKSKSSPIEPTFFYPGKKAEQKKEEDKPKSKVHKPAGKRKFGLGE